MKKKKKGALFATALAIQEKNIQEDVLLIAGDNYFGFSLKKFISDFKAHSNHPLLAAYDIGDKEKARAFGVVVPGASRRSKVESRKSKGITNYKLRITDKVVKSFQEKPEHPLSTLVSTGCFAFPKRLLPEIVDFAKTNRDDLGKIFEHFLEQGEKVRFFSFAEDWFDIGSFSAYLEASKTLMKGRMIAEENVEISEDAKISGSVFLGKNVKILKNVVLENSIVLTGSTLENCEVRNSVVGRDVFVSDVDLDGKVIRDESFLVR